MTVGSSWRGMVAVGLMGMALLAFDRLAFAAEFTADVMEQRGGKAFNGKIYVKDDKIRKESNIGGKSDVRISRMDKGLVWNILPDQKKYMEMRGAKGEDWDTPERRKEMEKLAERKELGTEKVEGYDCEKVQYIYRDESMGTLTQWISKKLKHPIKMEFKTSKGEMIREYKNIKEGGVPDSLFELPEGYEKVAMPGMTKGKGNPQKREGSPQ